MSGQYRNINKLIIVIILLSLGLWLRVRFINNVNLYPDEFVTLFAIQMINESGAPVMPSGLFYEHGLLFSYFGSVAAWFGAAPLMVRYVSLTLGLMTIGGTFFIGRSWFSPMVGLIAAASLVVAPEAIHWSGRARMYALLQLLVVLTLWFAYEGAVRNQAKWRWLALFIYLGALLTHFVSIILAPPLALTLIVLIWLQHQSRSTTITPLKDFLAPKHLLKILPEIIGLGVVVVIGFLVKRLGQPKGIEPLEAENTVSGLAQVFTIYSDFSFAPIKGWQAVNPFFFNTPTWLFALFALILTVYTVFQIVILLKNRSSSSQPGQIKSLFPTIFLILILLLSTLEMILFVSPDRRDDKYLFMLLPVLFLLGAQGMIIIGQLFARVSERWDLDILVNASLTKNVVTVGIIIGIIFLTRPEFERLLANTGDDYETAFAYVQAHWQEGDAILSGTPTAAALYLGRNDYYSVQRRGGYDYRILNEGDQAVDRWLGSPAIRTEVALQQTLANQNVWLILERWGLQSEYYDLPFQQQLLAQTDYVAEVEAQGIFVLQSKPNPHPIQLEPQQTVDAILGDQVQLQGYTVEPDQVRPGQPLRLTLYWQALSRMSHDYTVFVHLRTLEGGNVAQADHRPLGAIYPTTIWPVGEIIRESSDLFLPAELSAGKYELWTGLYLLETGERLIVQNDQSGENAVLLGQITIE